MTSRIKKPVADPHSAPQRETGPNIYKLQTAMLALVVIGVLILALHVSGGTLRSEEIALMLAVLALMNGSTASK